MFPKLDVLKDKREYIQDTRHLIKCMTFNIFCIPKNSGHYCIPIELCYPSLPRSLS